MRYEISERENTMTLTEELITAAVTATDDRKAAALKALRGEIAAQPGKIIQGPLLLGVGAAAKFLGVSRGTFWRAMQAGKIRKVELHSGSFRVRKEDLLELAAGGGSEGLGQKEVMA
jgi:excisionase family DNA binding protein